MVRPLPEISIASKTVHIIRKNLIINFINTDLLQLLLFNCYVTGNA